MRPPHCMDTSSDKLMRLHMRRPEHGYKGESPLIATQNNSIRTNYIIAKVDNKLQNRKCMLCGDRGT